MIGPAAGLATWNSYVWHAATTPPAIPDESLVTPGWMGFAITFGLALVVVLIVADMIRRVRRMNYRAEVREKLDNEEAIAAAEVQTAAEAQTAAEVAAREGNTP